MAMTNSVIKRFNIVYFIKNRFYSSTQSHTYEEVKIPVPWGYVAGKWWGPQNKRPILAVHGWQDNSGSFDTLIPLLNSQLSFLAIDFPGHGLSSQLPPGLFYHSTEYIFTVKRIVDYFNWHKVSLMGHSLGGITSYLYTILYPNTVDFLIAFDALKPLPFNIKKIGYLGKEIDNFIKYDYHNNSNDEPPSYSLEELEFKLHEGTGKSIDLNTCKYILQRGIVPSTKGPDKYYYKRDARLKVLPLLDNDETETLKNVCRLTCPTIMCLAKHRSRRYKGLDKANSFYEAIQKTNKRFEIHYVDGSHHVHLNNPERLQAFINAFITKYDLQDRSKGGLKPEIKTNFNS